jgi:peroxiredoxin Q/BCP
MKAIKLLTVLFLAMATALHAEIKLKVGDTAPKIEGIDQDEKPWKLEDVLAKKKAVLLYFYPKDNTPGCTKQAQTLRQRMETFAKRNLEVVGVSFDDCASHREFIKQHDLNFTLLADTEGKIADAYGVRMPDKARAKRVTFLINPAGKIVYIIENPNADIHLEQIKDGIAKLGK